MLEMISIPGFFISFKGRVDWLSQFFAVLLHVI